MVRTLIYDIGANNGDDIPYYLLKADVVVAVEANPRLCRSIESRFAREIERGRLFVESCAVTDDPDATAVDFHVHRTSDVLSQMPPRGPERQDEFERIRVPAKSILDTFFRHLARDGTGWVDIHATNEVEPDHSVEYRMPMPEPVITRKLVWDYLRRRLRQRCRSLLGR